MFSDIESYGTEAIPLKQRKDGIIPPFLLMVNFFINPATIFTAAMGVFAGLSVGMVIAVQLAGVMLAMTVFFVMARIGVDYGLTGQMACRAALGIRGGRWVSSPLRALCSIYWFAFQTQAGSLALSAVIYQQWQMDVPLIYIAAGFALLQILVAVIGYPFLQGLFRWAFPLKIICLIILCSALFNMPDIDAVNFWKLPDSKREYLELMIWFNAVFGSIMTIITDAADFTRYVNSRRALWIGGMLGSALGVIVAAAFGATLMAVLQTGLDELFHDFLGLTKSPLITFSFLMLLVLDSWTINVINLYSGGISLCHTLEKLRRSQCTAVVSVLGVALSCFPGVIEHFMIWAERAGMLFAAIVGVLLVDYRSRNWQLDVKSLYGKTLSGATMLNPYWYWNGFSIKAFLVIDVVLLAAMLLPKSWPVPLMTMILAGLVYGLSLRERVTQADHLL